MFRRPGCINVTADIDDLGKDSDIKPYEGELCFDGMIENIASNLLKHFLENQYNDKMEKVDKVLKKGEDQ